MSIAQATVRVNADQKTAWAYVSNYQNFDKIMSNIEKVEMTGPDTSDWKMHGPLGIPVSWKAITTSMEAPSYLAWKSTEGTIETHGHIRVLPETNGSSVTVFVEYTPPLGGLGEAVAKLFNDPQKQLEDDLSKLGGLIGDAPTVAHGVSGSSAASTVMGAAGTTAAGTSTDYGMAGNVDSTAQKAENMTGGMADTGEMLTSDGRTLESALADAAETTPSNTTSGSTTPVNTSSAGSTTRVTASETNTSGVAVSTPDEVSSSTKGPYDTDGSKTNTNYTPKAGEVRK